LYVKYNDPEGNNYERDIFKEVLIKHQSNRLAGYGPFLIALVNSIHFVEKSALLKNQMTGAINEDQYFQVLDQAVRNYLRSTSGKFGMRSGVGETKNTDKPEFLLVVDDLQLHNKRVYYSPAYFAIKH
jgi:hypothetical protein